MLIHIYIHTYIYILFIIFHDNFLWSMEISPGWLYEWYVNAVDGWFMDITIWMIHQFIDGRMIGSLWAGLVSRWFHAFVGSSASSVSEIDPLDRQRWANGIGTTAKRARQWLWFHRPRRRRVHVRLAPSGQAAAPDGDKFAVQLGVAENGVTLQMDPNGHWKKPAMMIKHPIWGFQLDFQTQVTVRSFQPPAELSMAVLASRLRCFFEWVHSPSLTMTNLLWQIVRMVILWHHKLTPKCHHPKFITIWAFWCWPCVLGIPHFEKHLARHQSNSTKLQLAIWLGSFWSSSDPFSFMLRRADSKPRSKPLPKWLVDAVPRCLWSDPAGGYHGGVWRCHGFPDWKAAGGRRTSGRNHSDFPQQFWEGTVM